MRINTNKITNWKKATKTKSLKAKHMSSLLIDKTVATKFLVDTLEGREPIKEDAMVCVGEAGDAWQQTSKKLLAKYTVTSIDSNGWLGCDPKPDNEVNVVEVEYSWCSVDGHNKNVFSIIGQWGATVGEEKNVQCGEVGDFICQNQSDPTDVWIVKRAIFNNSYTIKS